jgi:hypothetical protein
MRQREEELLRENIRREERMLREELLMRRDEPMMVDREELSLRRRESDYLRGGGEREGGVGSSSMSEALRMYVADDRKLEEYQRARNQAVYGRAGAVAVPQPPPPPIMPHSARHNWAAGVPPPLTARGADIGGGGSEMILEKARQKLFRR